EHLHERRVVPGGREAPAAAGYPRSRLIVGRRLEAAVGATAMDRDNPRSFRLCDDEVGVGHPERIEDVLTEIGVERLPTQPLDEPADPVGARAVNPLRAGPQQTLAG